MQASQRPVPSLGLPRAQRLTTLPPVQRPVLIHRGPLGFTAHQPAVEVLWGQELDWGAGGGVGVLKLSLREEEMCPH